jgi:hypothetical protein
MLLQGNHDIKTRLAADDARNVAAARGVVGEHDGSGTEAPLGSVAGLDLALAGKSDHVLPQRRGMPVLNVARRRVTEDNALAGRELADVDLDLFEMRMAVRSGVEPRDFHDSALVENLAGKSKPALRPSTVLRTNGAAGMIDSPVRGELVEP